jgi:hypothetical protein
MRHFRFWEYGVSHSVLYLMSNREDVADRVMLMAKGVDRVCMPTAFEASSVRWTVAGDFEHVEFDTRDGGASLDAVALFLRRDEGYSWTPFEGWLDAPDDYWVRLF